MGFQLAIFGVTGALIYLGIYHGMPKLLDRGVPVIYAFFGLLWAPILPLLPLSLAMFARLEDGTTSPAAIMHRFRLLPIAGSDWAWIGGGVLLTVLSEQALEGVGRRLARIPLLTPPRHMPAPFNPLLRMPIPPRDFLGVPLKARVLQS